MFNKLISKIQLLFLFFPMSVMANCWVEAGDRYKLDPWLLYSIAKQESGLRSDAINKNKDGSEDLGIMQINTRHLPKLTAYGIRRVELFDPCTNIMVGAWILAENFYRFGRNWNAVGMYNAGTMPSLVQQKKRDLYASRIINIYRDAMRRGK